MPARPCSTDEIVLAVPPTCLSPTQPHQCVCLSTNQSTRQPTKQCTCATQALCLRPSCSDYTRHSSARATKSCAESAPPNQWAKQDHNDILCSLECHHVFTIRLACYTIVPWCSRCSFPPASRRRMAAIRRCVSVRTCRILLFAPLQNAERRCKRHCTFHCNTLRSSSGADATMHARSYQPCTGPFCVAPCTGSLVSAAFENDLQSASRP